MFGKKDKHKCVFGVWSEPLTLTVKDSFHTTTKVYQVRYCNSCCVAESHTITEVRS
jgi:hypothetical protein